MTHSNSSSSTMGSGSGIARLIKNKTAEMMAKVGKRSVARWRRIQDVNGSMEFVTRFNKKALGVTIA